MAENSKIRYLVRSARLRGMTVDEFCARIDRGQKYCSRCKDWHHVSAFGADRGNSDGLLNFCMESTRINRPRRHAGGMRKGGTLPPEAKAKMKIAHLGERNANWRGGITPATRRARQNADYKAWRANVLARDDGVCQKCGDRPEKPHAHHIQTVRDRPDLILDVENGMTVCATCHRKIHLEEK